MPTSNISYQDYLLTPGWRRKRKGALTRAGFRCERCDGKRDLQVHHRTYERLGDERPEDLEVLCASCHEQHHYEQGQLQTLGIYLRLISDILRTERIETIADLSEALKTRCVKERIWYDAARVHQSIQIAASDGKRRLNTPLQVPTAEHVDDRPTSAAEAREVLRELGLAKAVKQMPHAEPITQRQADKARALQMVAALMVDSIERCERLEAETGATTDLERKDPDADRHQ
jgi:hypothetical protein